MRKIRLLIISSNQAIRQGLASLFSAHDCYQVVAEIDSLTDTEYLKKLQPDVALYGLYGSDTKNIAIISDFKKICPYTLVIVFSNISEHSFVIETFLAGADGYIKAPILPADLTSAIDLACRNEICFFPRTSRETLMNPQTINQNRAKHEECHCIST